MKMEPKPVQLRNKAVRILTRQSFLLSSSGRVETAPTIVEAIAVSEQKVEPELVKENLQSRDEAYIADRI